MLTWIMLYQEQNEFANILYFSLRTLPLGDSCFSKMNLMYPVDSVGEVSKLKHPLFYK